MICECAGKPASRLAQVCRERARAGAAALRLGCDHVEARVERRGDGGRRRRRENERPRALDQVFDRPRRSRDERSADAERLARRVDRQEHVVGRCRALRSARCRVRRRSRPRAPRRRSTRRRFAARAAAYSASGATSPSMLNSDSTTTNFWPGAGIFGEQPRQRGDVVVRKDHAFARATAARRRSGSRDCARRKRSRRPLRRTSSAPPGSPDSRSRNTARARCP